MSQYCENCPDRMACAVSGCTGPLVCECCKTPIAQPEESARPKPASAYYDTSPQTDEPEPVRFGEASVSITLERSKI